MTKPDAAARAAAMFERTQRQAREMSENPDIAGGVVGAAVFHLIRSGDEVSTASLIATLEAVASDGIGIPDINGVLARGALKVIADLQT